MGGVATGLVLLLAADVGALSLPYGEASRPRLCNPGSSEEAREAAPRSSPAGPWDRVRQQPVIELCLALARIQIRLASDPAGALAAAKQLARDWPDRAEPRMLVARASSRLGDAAASWVAWQEVRALDADMAREPGRELLSAHALRDYAVAAVLAGQTDLAAGAYRRLVSLLDAWPDPRDAQRLYLEAAAASLRRTPAQFDEALGYLSAAEAGARSTGLRAYAAGLRAFVRAWRGAAGTEPSRLAAPEIWHFVALARAEQRPSYWPAVPRHEVYALASMLVEPHSSAEASALWNLYVSAAGEAPVDATLSSFRVQRKARLERAEDVP
jgi:hypothetical protein